MTSSLIAIDATSLQQVIATAVHTAVRDAFAAQRVAAESPELLSREETARLLHVSYQTLSDWEKQGALTPTRAGRRVLFRRSEIERFLAAEGSR
jgi:excisionase family DNA binding protein